MVDDQINVPEGTLGATIDNNIQFSNWLSMGGASVPVMWGDQRDVYGQTFGFIAKDAIDWSIEATDTTVAPGQFSTYQFVRGFMQVYAHQIQVNLMPFNSPMTTTKVVWQTPADQSTWLSDNVPGDPDTLYRLDCAPGDSVASDKSFRDQPRVLIPNQQTPVTINGVQQHSRWAFYMAVADNFETDLVWTPRKGESPSSSRRSLGS